MRASIQELAVFGIVGSVLVWWSLKLTRPLWLPSVTRWLLHRGHVKWAMRLRFGKRSY
jgi:hypothetical protein